LAITCRRTPRRKDRGTWTTTPSSRGLACPPQDYERNIREMIRLAREGGAGVILLDNELWAESPYRPILRTIAADSHVPLIDSLALVAEARSAHGARTSKRASAFSPASSASPAPACPHRRRVPRVARRLSVPTAMSIVGTDRQLGDLVPNSVLMHDDGTVATRRAGDGVWSATATLAPGTRVSYVYTKQRRPLPLGRARHPASAQRRRSSAGEERSGVPADRDVRPSTTCRPTTGTLTQPATTSSQQRSLRRSAR